ncbi:MAG: acetolactate synthase small subunit [Syntrophales bacterium]|jgi:acetolactate synthase-1/3 small subunit|nr:acetolactate synthase small subunit [Syntrophales bacterium]MCK9528900.1 acetolactate synthase small subunit [Syntrophales bacterium]MDX9922812.1 acetolactate synthase small subunit [Syntrophales bacterium]
MEVKHHTVSLLVKNKPDVLARISGLLSGRGFNIENISANVTMKPDITKITLVTKGDMTTVEKIEKQMKKLVDVIDVFYIQETDAFQREMALVRMRASRETREAVMKVAEEFRCRILEETSDHLILEVTGESREISEVLTSLETLGMEDMSRSGLVVL